eukprot:4473740-Pleurochrysis_carterae.AAC.2
MLPNKFPSVDQPARFETWRPAERGTEGEGGRGGEDDTGGVSSAAAATPAAAAATMSFTAVADEIGKAEAASRRSETKRGNA